ncbi:hypothetical protein T09_10165 [Trichinella sp. T9]|nr:hypothetical protein T09_10165 [Trichinella sp. T9]
MNTVVLSFIKILEWSDLFTANCFVLDKLFCFICNLIQRDQSHVNVIKAKLFWMKNEQLLL